MADMIVPNSNPDVFNTRVFPGRQGILSPDNIEVPAGVEHPVFAVLKDAMSAGYDGVERVDLFRGSPNEEHRAARHDRETAELSHQVQTAYNDKVTRVEGELTRALADTEAKLAAKAGLKPNPAHFDAITSAFFSMKPEQRVETLAELIEQGENAALATLAEAPLFLTGLTAEQRDTINVRVLAKVDPVGLKLRDALALAQTRLANAHVASFGLFDKLRAGTAPGAAKERAAKAAARNMAANADLRR